MQHKAEQFELPLKPGKPIYSYSQVEAAKCGRRFYYGKIGAARELTYNLAAGKIFDCVFNAYYENNDHLKESHAERKLYARAAVELELEENPEWTRIEWSNKKGDVRSSPENFLHWLFENNAMDKVCRQDRGPVEVQKRVELELPDYKIVGYIDCVELDTNTVVDVKVVTGWSTVTEFSYAIRAQVPLYRMLLQDSTKQATKGRYDLLLCRKEPKLVEVQDYDIDFLQEKIISDFNAHHQKLCNNRFDKNPEQCFAYNVPCPAFQKCWPELTGLINKQ